MIAVLASSAGAGIAMAIGGIAAVLVISAVFYVIGRGEDRDRAAAARAPQAEAETAQQREPSTTPRGPERRLGGSPRRRRRR